MTLHLNIGSNIGRRSSAIERAVAALSARFPGKITVSRPVESEPWGYASPNPYLNVGVRIDMSADLPPAEALERVLDAERSICPLPHRDATGAYIDRMVDIDIIAIDEMLVATPSLTLPHPRMHLRPFVLGPLAELAPGWRHPILGLTASEILAQML